MVFRCIPLLSVTGLLVAMLTASTSAELPHRESAPHRCTGCATGQCQASTPHGFWKPTWRRWPGATSYRGFKRPTPKLEVPQSEVPEVINETRINARTRTGGSSDAGAGSGAGPAISTPDIGFGGPAGGGPTGSGSGSGSNDSPFATVPETDFPATTPPVAAPADPAPAGDMPAPPANLFDDLGPTPTPPAGSPVDDNLFDDLGAAAPTFPEETTSPPTISQRSIRSRRVAAATPKRVSVLTGLTVGEGNQLTDLLPSSLVAGMQRQLTPPQEQSLALDEMPVLLDTQPEADTIPTQPLPAPATVAQVSHEQEAPVREPSNVPTGSSHNPLRGPHRSAFTAPTRTATPAAAGDVQPPEVVVNDLDSQPAPVEPRKLEVAAEVKAEPQPSVPQKRVRRNTRRMNPLRT